MLDSKQTNDYLEQLLSCRSLTEIWKMYLEILAVFDFNHIIYATTNLGKSGLSESLKDGLVLSNHHPTLIKEMVDNKCFDNDTRWYSKNKINVMPWEEDLGPNEIDYSKYLFFPTIKKPMSMCERNAIKNYQKFNLNAGYTIFFKHSSGTGSSGFSLCSKLSQSETNRQWKKNEKTIMTLSKLFDLHLRQLPYVHFSLLPIRRKLTKRQREALHWISNGKSIVETSIIMNLSVPTIDKHLRLARENLDAKTTIEAVVKAQTNAQLYDFGFKT
jgi:LuxR family transcriptional regulator